MPLIYHLTRGCLAKHIGFVAVLSAVACPALAADPPSAELALSFKPAQPGVEIDIPEKADVARCQVKVERKDKLSGWVVLGPQGQVLRRFVDSNEDNVVDQWRYFRNGLEVYRDLDTDGNNKIDQSRWINIGGTRWGIDSNEDGKIDSWKILSAEEASRVAIEAMVRGDFDLLQTVLVGPADLKSLGLNADLSKQLLEQIGKPADKVREIARSSKMLTPKTSWMRFDSSQPGLVPADEGKATKDLYVYENAMAIVDVGGQAGLVQIGEMVRVGDVWKLTQIPQPLEGDTIQITSGGLLMQPPLVTPDGIPGSISPAMRELLEELQALDEKAPQPADGAEAFAKYNAERARILRGLVDASESAEDKEMWTRQFADSVSAAVQMGIFPDGLRTLAALEKQLADEKADNTLRAYVTYRRLLADYNQRLKGADAEGRVETQKWWLSQLTSYVNSYADSPDAAEALLHLALAEEFAGNLDEASAWYEKLAKSHADTGPGRQAAGALRRLGLKGKPLSLAGARLGGGKISAADFRGKVLLVLFWSTSCRPCEDDLPIVRALYQQYRKDGFEILGVNLDPTAEGVQPYMAKHQMTWPQIHEPGGQESPPAQQYGIISLPTMIIVGRDGKVISRGASIADLRAELPKLLEQ